MKRVSEATTACMPVVFPLSPCCCIQTWNAQNMKELYSSCDENMGVSQRAAGNVQVLGSMVMRAMSVLFWCF
jgi:hypothetical protein